MCNKVQNLFRQGIAAVNTQLELKQTEIEKLSQITMAHSPLDEVEKDLELVNSFEVRATNAAFRSFDSSIAKANELFTKVEALNPVAVLNRGFAYITHDENNVSSVSDVKPGDLLDITVKDGNFKAEVK